MQLGRVFFFFDIFCMYVYTAKMAGLQSYANKIIHNIIIWAILKWMSVKKESCLL